MNIACLCAFGLEGVVRHELHTLGYSETQTENGRINLEGDFSDVARLNFCLRAADRVVLPLGKFPASTFDELYEGARRAEFPFPKNARVMVSGKSVKSKLSAFEVCASVTKKALIDRACASLGVTSLTGEEEYRLTVSLREDVAELYLDTTGKGLSFRGYRRLNGPAAIRETLAAALVILSHWSPDKPFFDPFCGTGTLPIEAALYANAVPPNLSSTFDFEKWRACDANVPALRRALREKILSRPLEIFGSDIDENAVSMSRYHAKQAGVKVDFSVADIRKCSRKFPGGTLVTNPPYGERISDRQEARDLLFALSAYSKSAGIRSLNVITPERDFERIAGEKCRKRKLYNGGIECVFFQRWD